jgi:8-oxo-dGTP pyrophosphatase MutT (NUDIX family)
MKLLNFMNEAKIVSCGLVLTDGEVFLAVHPTLKNYWEIPKGVHEGGSPIDTMLREVAEEVGISLSKYKSEIQYKGKYKYLKHKDLMVYVLKIKELPMTSMMKCSSTFSYKDRKFLEVDDYKYLKLNDLSEFRPEMARIIRDINGQT